MDVALSLISYYEGFSAEPYLCSGGYWTVGYGSTYWRDRQVTKDYPRSVTQEQAYDALEEEVTEIVETLGEKVPSWHHLTEGQRAALISFAYNLGWLPGSYGFDSLNAAVRQTPISINTPLVLKKYNKAADKVSLGLTRRRRAEGLVWYGKEVKDAIEFAELENPA